MMHIDHRLQAGLTLHTYDPSAVTDIITSLRSFSESNVEAQTVVRPIVFLHAVEGAANCHDVSHIFLKP